MKRILIVLLLLAISLSAAIVPVDRAQKVAENYYQNYAPTVAKGNTVQKILTKEYLGQSTWYVVQFTKGFVLVAAEDNVRPILGYSFDGKIDEDIYDMNNPFVSKFSNYDRQIVHVIREQGLVVKSKQKEWKNIENNIFSHSSVKALYGPLLETIWGQGYPWNDQCPIDTPVGSVATAIAQIMRFHQEPSGGNGSNSYSDSSGDTTGSHSVDFSAQTYDWFLMQTLNGGGTTQDEIDELAKMSYHLGVSVNMDYNTDGSGAQLSDALTALQNNWTCLESFYQNVGTITDSSAYNDKIKIQIDRNQPLLWSGSSVASGAHTFVVDGYNIDAGSGTYQYHFNWGWNGSYDGWYLLNDLTPGVGDFSESQEYISHIFVPGLGFGIYADFTDSTGVDGQDVFLEWEWAGENDPYYILSYYELYRDNELIEVIPDSTQTYTDVGLDYGEYTYRINAIYGPEHAPEIYNYSYYPISYYTADVVAPPPVIVVPASINEIVPPAVVESGSFDIDNIGDGILNYSISYEYDSFQELGEVLHTNDFSTFPGTGYTNSNWTDGGENALATGINNGVLCILTSPAFDTSNKFNVTLSFDHTFVQESGSAYVIAEYYDGAAWIELLNMTTSGSGTLNFPINISPVTQLRFIAYMDKSGGNPDICTIDNIIVESNDLPYTWLTFNSPLTGSVDPESNNTIHYDVDTSLLELSEYYYATISIASNDTTNNPAVIPFELFVDFYIPPPPRLYISITSSIITLSWDVIADATGYNIYSSSDPYGTFTLEHSTTELSWETTTSSTQKYYYLTGTDEMKEPLKEIKIEMTNKR